MMPKCIGFGLFVCNETCEQVTIIDRHGDPMDLTPARCAHCRRLSVQDKVNRGEI